MVQCLRKQPSRRGLSCGRRVGGLGLGMSFVAKRSLDLKDKEFFALMDFDVIALSFIMVATHCVPRTLVNSLKSQM